jgi:HemY protein
MWRVVIFLVTAALIALALAWFADEPGAVTVTWLGYRIDTSPMVAAFAVALIAAFFVIVWSIYRAILRSPERASTFFRHRRAMKGHAAITRGLIAVGAGDVHTARKAADEAARLSADEPLTLLLNAQAAQLSGDRGAAERAFRHMTRHPHTKMLGLRGLYIEAHRRNDHGAARLFAEEAAKTSPGVAWASQAALEHRCAAGDWAGALATLDSMKSSLDPAIYRRERAVLLTANAMKLEPTDSNAACAQALQAVKLAPDLVPAAVVAGRLLAQAGSLRKAGKIVDAAWRRNPHPDLIATYANLRFGDSARERRARVVRLAGKMPGHIESALALAQAALEAKDFAAARAALADHLRVPTRRVASLMADIEEAEGDVGRAREWMSRALRAAPDPAWTADGIVSDQWHPVSPVTGRLDAFQWKVPVAEIGVAHPVIEPETVKPVEPTPAIEAAAEPAPPSPTPPTDSVKPAPSVSAPPSPPVEKLTEKSAAPVIPVVHAPDDPGPDVAPDSEPVPESTSSGSLDRLRRLFG